MLLKLNEGQVVSSLLHCLCTLQSESLQLMYKVQYLGGALALDLALGSLD